MGSEWFTSLRARSVSGVGGAACNHRSPHHAAGTGLVRTLVVSCATLAILLVCFWIYQYTQFDSQVAADRHAARTASQTPEINEPSLSDGDPPGLATGRGIIGPGEQIRITFYPRKGNRARVELAVDSWTPVEGTANRFLLINPDIRMRTNDGHAVHILARTGTLEAERKPGGGLDPSRGTLAGGVVIKYDRLTEAERAARPSAVGDEIPPAELVQIEMEEMEFDLEYSKVIVPGTIRLTASDVEMETGDLEIRFDDEADRVEELRISRGGYLELRQQPGFSIPTLDTGGNGRVTLVEWLRASIRTKIEIAQEPKAPKPAPEPTPAAETTEDGVPVFRARTRPDEASEPPVRYHARFEGEIDMTQFAGETIRAGLKADTLEIVRAISSRERAQAVADRGDEAAGGPEAPTQRDRIVLKWKDRLVIKVCSSGDARCGGDSRSTITAMGSPVELSMPEGKAGCARLRFEPDGSRVWLYGTDAVPAVVELADQGTLYGRLIRSERIGDDLVVHVDGPGRLVRRLTEEGDRLPLSSTGSDQAANIEFTQSLDAYGRFVTRTTIDRSARISTSEQRVLDRAVFVGAVTMRQGDSTLAADQVTLTFRTSGGIGAIRQSIERVTADGHVTLTDGADRLTCRELDASFLTDSTGRTVPHAVVAMGNVVAHQGERTIRARDKLIVDFRMIERLAPLMEVTKRHSAAVTPTDVAEPRMEGESVGRPEEVEKRVELGITRFRAFGEVTIVDADAAIHVEAEEVDCAVKNGREIERALLTGLEGHPASVRIRAATVTGQRIRLDVPGERAVVPGAGRLTFVSKRDLDGRKTKEPIPISITWTRRMDYRGRDNRAVFLGDVHATSETHTTFDCDQLDVEFDDIASEDETRDVVPDWWILQPLVDRAAGASGRDRTRGAGPVFSKEPAVIVATGNAVVLTSDVDPDTGVRKSRVRLAGPKVWVNLRDDVSRMQIEGPGTLLLEDNRPFAPTVTSSTTARGGLFDAGEDSGPSTTLIEWNELMWYDFSVQQTVFQGDVRLKHFSGAELLRLRGATALDATLPSGRATFLSAEVLKVDFLNRGQDAGGAGGRMGLLSSDRLRQFEALRSVVLQDDGEGLHLTADRLVYRRESGLLEIFGTEGRRALITTQKPGELPNQVSVKRLFYNLRTHTLEVSKPVLNVR